MESPLGLWLQFEAHRLSEAVPDDFSIKVPEGVIRVVRCPNGEHVGRIEWAGDYGERDFIRGTWDHVVLAACEQVLRGVSVSPQYRPSKEPELVRDRLHFKMNLPDGELRILQFFNLYLGVLIPQDGLRILAWADNLEDALLGSRHAIAPRETFRMALRIGGMRRELRVSSTPGVLAYCDVFDETFIVVPEAPFLRDKALNLWDAPAAVWRVRDSEPVGCVARFGSLMELDGNDILWSDEGPGGDRGRPATEPPTAATSARPPGRPTSSASASALIPPRIHRLFCRLLDSLDLAKDAAPSMRKQFDRLLRECASREARDISGCSARLRAALEERAGITLEGRPRAFRYATASYRKHLPPGFCTAKGHEQTYAFSELRDGTAIAQWLEERFGHLEPAAATMPLVDWINYEHNTAPEGPPARSPEPRPAAPSQPGSRSHGNDHAQMSRNSETEQARAAEVRQSPRIEHASATDRAEQERARVTALLMQPRSAMPTATEQLYADAVARIERAASAASRPVDTARQTGPTGRPGGPTDK